MSFISLILPVLLFVYFHGINSEHSKRQCDSAAVSISRNIGVVNLNANESLPITIQLRREQSHVFFVDVLIVEINGHEFGRGDGWGGEGK